MEASETYNLFYTIWGEHGPGEQSPWWAIQIKRIEQEVEMHEKRRANDLQEQRELMKEFGF